MIGIWIPRAVYGNIPAMKWNFIDPDNAILRARNEFRRICQHRCSNPRAQTAWDKRSVVPNKLCPLLLSAYNPLLVGMYRWFFVDVGNTPALVFFNDLWSNVSRERYWFPNSTVIVICGDRVLKSLTVTKLAAPEKLLLLGSEFRSKIFL